MLSQKGWQSRTAITPSPNVDDILKYAHEDAKEEVDLSLAKDAEEDSEEEEEVGQKENRQERDEDARSNTALSEQPETLHEAADRLDLMEVQPSGHTEQTATVYNTMYPASLLAKVQPRNKEEKDMAPTLTGSILTRTGGPSLARSAMGSVASLLNALPENEIEVAKAIYKKTITKVDLDRLFDTSTPFLYVEDPFEVNRNLPGALGPKTFRRTMECFAEAFVGMTTEKGLESIFLAEKSGDKYPPKKDQRRPRPRA